MTQVCYLYSPPHVSLLVQLCVVTRPAIHTLQQRTALNRSWKGEEEEESLTDIWNERISLRKEGGTRGMVDGVS
jgi:hypothetical protein